MKFVLTGIDPENPETWKNGGGRAMIYLHSLLHYIGQDCEINVPVEPDDVVVYPDCVQGNPCNANKILRWMLYFWPGERIPASECVIVYHEAYFDQVAQRYDRELPVENIVELPTIEPGLFYPEEKTSEALLYTGKQTVTTRPEGDFIEISKWNMSRAECASLLRRSKNLYTMDHHTIMIAEAALCRCDPWLVNENGTVIRITTAPSDFQGCIMDPHRDAALARKFVQIATDFFK